eukprot:2404801-Amphidinium_carterae.1
MVFNAGHESFDDLLQAMLFRCPSSSATDAVEQAATAAPSSASVKQDDMPKPHQMHPRCAGFEQVINNDPKKHIKNPNMN